MYLPQYDQLCKELSEEWQPVQGLRSFTYQDSLYAKGRTLPGKIVTKSPGGLSFHNYGLATDWDFFDEGAYTPLEFEDPRWQEYIDACNKVGLRCIPWERPHNEYPARASVREFYDAFRLEGYQGVLAVLIKEGRENGK